MLYLRMYRGELPAKNLNRLSELKRALGDNLKPLLMPTLATPASILGVDPENLRVREKTRRDITRSGATVALDGELYTDVESVVALAIHIPRPTHLLDRRQRMLLASRQNEETYRLEINAIGPRWECTAVAPVLSAVEKILGVSVEPYYYPSDQFDELKSEGHESPTNPSEGELEGSNVLSERSVRALAIAIKASGGLLVRDVAKQLSVESRDQADDLVQRLKTSRIVDSEIVVVCSKTQAQVTRAASRELINELSLKGLKCACGRPMIDERIEEALTITDLGRGLLDKARWLGILLVRELGAVGVSPEAILIEQTVGGDEMDCLANISGELVLFELKDKEFNLGSAYSFGAKIGIIKPRYPVIVTTEHVGNDAKEHFVRAGVSGASRGVYIDPSDERDEISYIEGVDSLIHGVEKLATKIYQRDAIRLLNQVVPLATLDGERLIDAMHRIAGEKAAASTAA